MAISRDHSMARFCAACSVSSAPARSSRPISGSSTMPMPDPDEAERQLEHAVRIIEPRHGGWRLRGDLRRDDDRQLRGRGGGEPGQPEPQHVAKGGGEDAPRAGRAPRPPGKDGPVRPAEERWQQDRRAAPRRPAETATARIAPCCTSSMSVSCSASSTATSTTLTATGAKAASRKRPRAFRMAAASAVSVVARTSGSVRRR